jgi:hypothetical protein
MFNTASLFISSFDLGYESDEKLNVGNAGCLNTHAPFIKIDIPFCYENPLLTACAF